MLKSSIQPDSLYSSQQSRELDRIAMQEFELGNGVLMARAGAAAFQLLRTCWPRSNKVLVFAGLGNNGGDGFVLAQLGHAAGLDVKVVMLVEANRYKGDADKALKDLLATGHKPLTSHEQLGQWQPEVIVDGLFGTGLDRAPEGLTVSFIDWINRQPLPVLALDIPSGLNADTGIAPGAVVQASCTLSLIGLKPGLLTAQGPQYCGTVYFHDLDIPPAVYQRVTPVAKTFSPRHAEPLPPLRSDTHKFRQGHVLVAGGDVGMAGAPCLAAEAAYRSGAGLVSMLCHTNTMKQLRVRPEIMVTTSPENDQHNRIARRLHNVSVVVLGPGLGQRSWGESLFAKTLDHASQPMVVDADGLRWLANNPQRRTNWVLTPHPGEAAALLQTTVAAVQANRFQAAKKISETYGGVCILKGAGSVIACEDIDQFTLIREGNPGMATGGMGDVLAGIIAGLIGLGSTPRASARTGAWVHASAADLALKEQGRRGLMASDLLPHIAGQIAQLPGEQG